ncbi:unnamed protein product [Rotaria magnacalcarata]|uniref:Uncharacterized protein n=1 Tax=Rotaria magnacalcarata TaxID=392030 RepID=A0A816SA64_9BILA|nr:unnamed protein product [Rotaria magnacalcarata]
MSQKATATGNTRWLLPNPCYDMPRPLLTRLDCSTVYYSMCYSLGVMRRSASTFSTRNDEEIWGKLIKLANIEMSSSEDEEIEYQYGEDTSNYSTEILKSLTPPGMLPYKLNYAYSQF